MVPEPPEVPVIEEITITDSSDDDDEASSSNNGPINKENTHGKCTEKTTDPLSDMSFSPRLSNEYYNCDPLGDDCGSPRPSHENPSEDPLADISIAESYSLEDRLNGDFIILEKQRDLGIDDSYDEVSGIYVETSNNASDHTTTARSNKNDDDSDKQLYIVDDADDHTALSNNNHDDCDKQLYIVDDADDHTALSNKNDDDSDKHPYIVDDADDHTGVSNKNYDDSDKQLYIADDTYPPDHNKAPVPDTNVTDKAVSKETEKSLSNANATAEKEETMDFFENDEKTTDDAKIGVDEDSGIKVVITSGDAEKKLDIAPTDQPSRMRVCLKQLLMPFCHKCHRPRFNTRAWTRRHRSNCITCGAELTYRCLACEFEDSCLTRSLWHVKRCCSKKLWRCYKCPFASVFEERVKAHIGCSHSNKENEDREDNVKDHWGYYRCNICRKGFKSLGFLRMHEHYCGVERTVSIVKNEKPVKKERTVKKEKTVKQKTIKRRRKKKEPVPGVVEEVKKNADDYIKLHCYKCSLIFEKGKREKKCDKCETPLLWLCVKCSTKSKSYCGLYDHVNNCTNEIAQLILV